MKKSINKLSKKLRDAIIKEVPTAESINYKGVNMSQVTNKQILYALNEFRSQVNGRLDSIENRLDRIENTPTIKKELAK